MTADMLAEYDSDPLAMDKVVRRHFRIPEDRYYTVATFPLHLAGEVAVELDRTVNFHKISKSNP